jgi:hypothetical protein
MVAFFARLGYVIAIFGTFSGSCRREKAHVQAAFQDQCTLLEAPETKLLKSHSPN